MVLKLLIDGYNLCHATGAIGHIRGPDALRRSRERMLTQLANGLSEVDRVATTVVFDAARRDTSQSETEFRGISIVYSAGYKEADDLIEQLIRQHPNPKLLTVVSSDLRIQRCALSRSAQAIDCDTWLMDFMERLEPSANPVPTEGLPKRSLPQRSDSDLEADSKPEEVPREEVSRWLDEFGL